MQLAKTYYTYRMDKLENEFDTTDSNYAEADVLRNNVFKSMDSDYSQTS